MKIIDLIFCDDIRREIGNKLTLVGCYNDRLEIRKEEFEKEAAQSEKKELHFPLAVYLRVLLEGQEKEFNSFSFTLTDGQSDWLKATGQIAVKRKPDFPIVLMFRKVLSIKGEAELYPQLDFYDGDEVVLELKPEISFKVKTVSER
jgi:hypothetical protein